MVEGAGGCKGGGGGGGVLGVLRGGVGQRVAHSSLDIYSLVIKEFRNLD